MNIIEDLSVLTHVPETVLQKFIPQARYAIGHALHESMCQQKDTTVIDLGIGVLHILQQEQSLKYRFVPSKELEGMLVQTVTTRCSPIVQKLSTDLQEKIDKAYKELL